MTDYMRTTAGRPYDEIMIYTVGNAVLGVPHTMGETRPKLAIRRISLALGKYNIANAIYNTA